MYSRDLEIFRHVQQRSACDRQVRQRFTQILMSPRQVPTYSTRGLQVSLSCFSITRSSGSYHPCIAPSNKVSFIVFQSLYQHCILLSRYPFGTTPFRPCCVSSLSSREPKGGTEDLLIRTTGVIDIVDRHAVCCPRVPEAAAQGTSQRQHRQTPRELGC